MSSDQQPASTDVPDDAPSSPPPTLPDTLTILLDPLESTIPLDFYVESDLARSDIGASIPLPSCQLTIRNPAAPHHCHDPHCGHDHPPQHSHSHGEHCHDDHCNHDHHPQHSHSHGEDCRDDHCNHGHDHGHSHSSSRDSSPPLNRAERRRREQERKRQARRSGRSTPRQGPKSPPRSDHSAPSTPQREVNPEELAMIQAERSRIEFIHYFAVIKRLLVQASATHYQTHFFGATALLHPETLEPITDLTTAKSLRSFKVQGSFIEKGTLQRLKQTWGSAHELYVRYGFIRLAFNILMLHWEDPSTRRAMPAMLARQYWIELCDLYRIKGSFVQAVLFFEKFERIFHLMVGKFEIGQVSEEVMRLHRAKINLYLEASLSESENLELRRHWGKIVERTAEEVCRLVGSRGRGGSSAHILDEFELYRIRGLLLRQNLGIQSPEEEVKENMETKRILTNRLSEIDSDMKRISSSLKRLQVALARGQGDPQDYQSQNMYLDTLKKHHVSYSCVLAEYYLERTEAVERAFTCLKNVLLIYAETDLIPSEEVFYRTLSRVVRVLWDTSSFSRALKSCSGTNLLQIRLGRTLALIFHRKGEFDLSSRCMSHAASNSILSLTATHELSWGLAYRSMMSERITSGCAKSKLVSALRACAKFFSRVISTRKNAIAIAEREKKKNQQGGGGGGGRRGNRRNKRRNRKNRRGGGGGQQQQKKKTVIPEPVHVPIKEAIGVLENVLDPDRDREEEESEEGEEISLENSSFRIVKVRNVRLEGLYMALVLPPAEPDDDDEVVVVGETEAEGEGEGEASNPEEEQVVEEESETEQQEQEPQPMKKKKKKKPIWKFAKPYPKPLNHSDVLSVAMLVESMLDLYLLGDYLRVVQIMRLVQAFIGCEELRDEMRSTIVKYLVVSSLVYEIFAAKGEEEREGEEESLPMMYSCGDLHALAHSGKIIANHRCECLYVDNADLFGLRLNLVSHQISVLEALFSSRFQLRDSESLDSLADPEPSVIFNYGISSVREFVLQRKQQVRGVHLDSFISYLAEVFVSHLGLLHDKYYLNKIFIHPFVPTRAEISRAFHVWNCAVQRRIKESRWVDDIIILGGLVPGMADNVPEFGDHSENVQMLIKPEFDAGLEMYVRPTQEYFRLLGTEILGCFERDAEQDVPVVAMDDDDNEDDD